MKFTEERPEVDLPPFRTVIKLLLTGIIRSLSDKSRPLEIVDKDDFDGLEDVSVVFVVEEQCGSPFKVGDVVFISVSYPFW